MCTHFKAWPTESGPSTKKRNFRNIFCTLFQQTWRQGVDEIASDKKSTRGRLWVSSYHAGRLKHHRGALQFRTNGLLSGLGSIRDGPWLIIWLCTQHGHVCDLPRAGSRARVPAQYSYAITRSYYGRKFGDVLSIRSVKPVRPALSPNFWAHTPWTSA